jgi:hypothetical protein
MLANVFRRRPARLVAGNENAPQRDMQPGAPAAPEKVRALATGAALAVAVDVSPAVLVSIQHYAQRYRDRGRRSA